MAPTSRSGWILIALVLIVRAVAVWRAGPPVLEGDSMHYHDIAMNLSAGHGFAFSPSQQMPWQREPLGTPQPTALRPPLYPLFLAALYRVGSGP
jgi:hypothetical protein